MSSSTSLQPTRLSNFQLVFNRSLLPLEVTTKQWEGSGTHENPYLVEWIPNDPRSALNFSSTRKWIITVLLSFSCLAVSFSSSAYVGGINDIESELHASNIISLLGVSVFVLGFAIGPLIWAPMSEQYGRQILSFITLGGTTIFNSASAGAQTITQLIILRFLAGASGSAPLTNAGGVIADIFSANERGLAMSLFSCGPFLGPTLGSIAGGFVGEAAGWRWVMGMTAIFTGVFWIAGALYIPETYGPVLLRDRATALTRASKNGEIYVSRLDRLQGRQSITQLLKIGLSRPWALLFLEPIVFVISTYMAIIYGTMYMLFAAFPIIFQTGRGWSAGMSGLAFTGITIGMIVAFGWMFWENRQYKLRAARYPDGRAPPEERLRPCMVGALAAPIGLFWFAWTNSGSIPWIVCIVASVPFGFGNVLLYLSCMNYLVDTYTIYAASCMAGSSVLRSLLGAAFPLFTHKMYDNLGIHWASSIPAFLSLACVPAPFIFFRYGVQIRRRGKYVSEAARILAEMLRSAEMVEASSEESSVIVIRDAEKRDGSEKVAPHPGREVIVSSDCV